MDQFVICRANRRASMTGVYLILVELSEGQRIQTGRGACFSLAKGFYSYVGSALGGLEKRVARHLSAEKKLHWHIDYLMDRGRVKVVIGAETKQKEECLVASALSQRLSSISGFGSSDCNCRSHLFFSEYLETLKGHALYAFQSRDLSPFEIAPFPG